MIARLRRSRHDPCDARRRPIGMECHRRVDGQLIDAACLRCLSNTMSRQAASLRSAHRASPPAPPSLAGFPPPVLELRESLRRAMLHFLVHDFLVAIEREVVALRRDFRLRHTKTLLRPRALALRAIRSRQRASTSGRLFFACSSSLSAVRGTGRACLRTAAACACRRGSSRRPRRRRTRRSRCRRSWSW